jgi:hypothetical protein
MEGVLNQDFPSFRLPNQFPVYLPTYPQASPYTPQEKLPPRLGRPAVLTRALSLRKANPSRLDVHSAEKFKK